MDHQPLNTGKQKDMTEFFTDLTSKMEEMGPSLKRCVKSLFGGVQTNNVVSLDCPHVSRTKEEFYTARCQVADMRILQVRGRNPWWKRGRGMDHESCCKRNVSFTQYCGEVGTLWNFQLRGSSSTYISNMKRLPFKQKQIKKTILYLMIWSFWLI